MRQTCQLVDFSHFHGKCPHKYRSLLSLHSDDDQLAPPDRNFRAIMHIFDAIVSALELAYRQDEEVTRVLGRMAVSLLSFLVSHDRERGPGALFATTATTTTTTKETQTHQQEEPVSKRNGKSLAGLLHCITPTIYDLHLLVSPLTTALLTLSSPSSPLSIDYSLKTLPGAVPILKKPAFLAHLIVSSLLLDRPTAIMTTFKYINWETLEDDHDVLFSRLPIIKAGLYAIKDIVKDCMFHLVSW